MKQDEGRPAQDALLNNAPASIADASAVFLAALRPARAGLHPDDRCSWCGARRDQVQLRRVTLQLTRAPALVCQDIVACSRRRRRVAA